MPTYVIFSTGYGRETLILKLSPNKQYYNKFVVCDNFVDASGVLRALLEFENKEEDNETSV
jgi:hypothetical protein